MRHATCNTASILLLVLLGACEEGPLTLQGKPIPEEVIAATCKGPQQFFTKLSEKGPWDTLGVRSIFSNALVLAELGWDLSVLDKPLEIAEAMQDLDPSSRTFGNFRWYWFNEKVGDQNAVEFSMQAAGLLYRRHRDELPPKALERLERIMRNSVKGVLNHNVSESYTNIFLMKTWNLICLGEVMNLPEIAETGYEHLDRFVVHAAENGVTEYLSPTYYGTDLDSIGLIATFARRKPGRDQAEALLRLFWSDIAANWCEPAGRLGGAHSRDYDYLFGRGYLDQYLQAKGWLPLPERYNLGGMLFALLSTSRPDPQLRKLSLGRFPRLTRQSWGDYWYQTAANYVTESYALGSAGAAYGTMDKPLVVLFADRDLVGGYYLMDARKDPYGKSKIAEGTSGHKKALHLRPFLTTVQDDAEALLLAAPTPDRYVPESDALASHLVLPAGVEQCFVGDKRIDTKAKCCVALEPGEPVFLIHRGAILGVKVPAAKTLDGADAKVELVHDAAEDKAMRLTVTHYSGPARKIEPGKAMVALWARMGAADGAFRENFTIAKAMVDRRGDIIRVAAAGMRSELVVEADLAKQQRIDATINGKRPEKFILAVNGDDIGRRIMEQTPPVAAYRRVLEAASVVLEAGRPTTVEAESASGVLKPMEIGRDRSASGGKFIWMRGEAGGKGGSSVARAVWPIEVRRGGVYYLWGRVLTPTPDDDSFFVSVDSSDGEVAPRLDWHTGVHPEWAWVRVTPRDMPEDWLRLPAGRVRLQFHVREDGSRLDALFITDSPETQPEGAVPKKSK